MGIGEWDLGWGRLAWQGGKLVGQSWHLESVQSVPRTFCEFCANFTLHQLPHRPPAAAAGVLVSEVQCCFCLSALPSRSAEPIHRPQQAEQGRAHITEDKGAKTRRTATFALSPCSGWWRMCNSPCGASSCVFRRHRAWSSGIRTHRNSFKLRFRLFRYGREGQPSMSPQ